MRMSAFESAVCLVIGLSICAGIAPAIFGSSTIILCGRFAGVVIFLESFGQRLPFKPPF